MGTVAKRILIGAAILAVVFCAASFAIDRMALARTYARYVPEMPSLMPTDADIADEYPSDQVEFQFKGETLRGHIYGPANNGRGLIVFRHGIFSQHQDYLALITELVDRGWKVLAYDAIGCGESDGDNVIGMTESALDVDAVLTYVEESGLAGELPVFLMGHSWGGFGVAASLNFDHDVRACATLSGFDSTMGILTESAVGAYGPLGYSQVPFLWLNTQLAFGADTDLSAAKGIDRAGIPVLVIHGDGDDVISFNGASIYAQAGRIANPQVEYLAFTEEGRNGHNTYFYSRESQAYLDEQMQRLQELIDADGGEIDDEQFREFRSTVDIERANTANPDLIDAIDTFFEKWVEVPGTSTHFGME